MEYILKLRIIKNMYKNKIKICIIYIMIEININLFLILILIGIIIIYISRPIPQIIFKVPNKKV